MVPTMLSVPTVYNFNKVHLTVAYHKHENNYKLISQNFIIGASLVYTHVSISCVNASFTS